MDRVLTRCTPVSPGVSAGIIGHPTNEQPHTPAGCPTRPAACHPPGPSVSSEPFGSPARELLTLSAALRLCARPPRRDTAESAPPCEPDSPSRRLHDDEAGAIVALVLDVGGEDLEAVDPCGISARDRGDGRVAAAGEVAGGAGG